MRFTTIVTILGGASSVLAASPRPTAAPVARLNRRAGGGVGMSVVSSGMVPVSRARRSESSSASSSEVPPPVPVPTETLVAQESSSVEVTRTETAEAAQNTAEAVSDIDLVVLQFALQLERLETEFYHEALQRFDLHEMVAAGLSEHQARIIIEEAHGILANEATHVEVLSSVITSLGGTPIDQCQFNFDSALASASAFLATARTLELVGVGAYAGGASLISSKSILTAAATIVTIESRHSSLLNAFNAGSFQGQPFDIALAPEQVLALAGGFLRNCSAEDLGLSANQPLSIRDARDAQNSRFAIGTQLAFESTVEIEESFFCQMIVGGAPLARVFPVHSCSVPDGIDGPVVVFVTRRDEPLFADVVVQQKGDIVAGPGIVFIDSRPSHLGALFAIGGAQHQLGSANLGYLYQRRLQGHEVEIIQIVQQVIVEQNIEINVDVDIDNNNDDRRNDRDRNRDRNDRKDNGRNDRDNERRPDDRDRREDGRDYRMRKALRRRSHASHRAH